MNDYTDIAASVFVLIGAAFSFLAGLGILRFPDVYVRMHAATKAGILGAGFVMIGIAVHAGSLDVTLRVLVGIVFLIVTAPIGSHLLGRAAYCSGVPMWSRTVVDDLKDRYGRKDQPPAATPMAPQKYE